MSGRFNIGDGAKEGTIFIDEMVLFVFPIKVTKVHLVKFVEASLFRSPIVSRKVLHNTLEHKAPFHLVPKDLSKGNWIGGITLKCDLIHIYAHSHHASLNAVAPQIILDKHTTKFPITVIDVVGPLKGEG